MTRDWQPGDVAEATFDHGGQGRVFRIMGAPSNWADMAGVAAPEGQVVTVRPLVVIDPEDREQVERLEALYLDNKYDGPGRTTTDLMQAALREFANPTPPKPNEPTGLGAVVEDAEGYRWVRRSTHPARSWSADTGSFQRAADYADIAAVRVLSEGVAR